MTTISATSPSTAQHSNFTSEFIQNFRAWEESNFFIKVCVWALAFFAALPLILSLVGNFLLLKCVQEYATQAAEAEKKKKTDLPPQMQIAALPIAVMDVTPLNQTFVELVEKTDAAHSPDKSVAMMIATENAPPGIEELIVEEHGAAKQDAGKRVSCLMTTINDRDNISDSRHKFNTLNPQRNSRSTRTAGLQSELPSLKQSYNETLGKKDAEIAKLKKKPASAVHHSDAEWTQLTNERDELQRKLESLEREFKALKFTRPI